MDYAIQKATELGVSSIQLLTSERCEMRLKYDRDQKKLDHWVRHCSLRTVWHEYRTENFSPTRLEDWFNSNLPATKLVLAPNKDQVDVLNNASKDFGVVGLKVVLSETEISAANAVGFENWCIGFGYCAPKPHLWLL